MKKIITAGGVIIHNNKFLLIIHRNGGKLGFPKGHVGKGESIEQAAIRETEEETGVRGVKIIKKLGVVNRDSIENSGEKVNKDIHLFLMEAVRYQQQTAEEESGWFTYKQALVEMKFEEERQFLEKLRGLIS